jgi:hypothetical protein
MTYPAIHRLIAYLLATGISGVAAAIGEQGYPPPPGPYLSGPWVATAVPAQPLPQTEPRAGSSTTNLSPPSAPRPLAKDPDSDYSATNLFGAPPTANDPTQVPAWPEALISAPREPLYEPPAKQADFSIGGKRQPAPGDFSAGFSQPMPLPPAGSAPPAQGPTAGWGQDADFSALPATIPGTMFRHGGNDWASPPAQGFTSTDRPPPRSPGPKASAPIAPTPKPAPFDTAGEGHPPGPAGTVFRPPGLTGD